MSSFSELDHYEVLEVAPEAGPDEIERAYRLARATYAADSMAAYSVLEPDDAAALRERIEIAYRVLSDVESRRAYDTELRRAARGEEPATGPLPPPPRPAPVAPATDPAVIAALDALDDGEGFDGARLRRARLLRGLELEQIAAVTKIHQNYLRCLEEESWKDLPAAVYVRGFVSAYARCVGLDPAVVAGDYMQRYRAAEVERRGPRPLHRR
jgi:curved DNA-binding protein CbpA